LAQGFVALVAINCPTSGTLLARNWHVSRSSWRGPATIDKGRVPQLPRRAHPAEV